jgi:maltooligosyltrehalose trehalohydrolase
MTAAEGGWFEVLCEEAHPGTRYTFRLPSGIKVPDPASRYQPDDVHGPSEVVNPCDFEWTDGDWQGRPWEEAVLYELHVGAFTRQGGFAGVQAKLDHLARLGVTVLQLMPLADFPGKRGWGYDGVLPYAPDSAYGRPEDLKQLVNAAHDRGMMVMLDVVYNHFGPDGNFLGHYARSFFTHRHKTPWGDAINFDGPDSRVVRDFFIHNALYWLDEFHFDGLRLDAVHTIIDDSALDILTELAQAVRKEFPDRHIHLVLENDDNDIRLLERDEAGQPKLFTAQWNDDLHHCFHVLATGERGGYYGDYVDQPARWLATAIEGGFAYQGEASQHRNGKPRGAASGHLPPGAFISFLQNHDQIGNRALGERLHQVAPREAVKALTAAMLLMPFPPMLFMGEEWASEQPFLYFCDYQDELARAVREGRRREFAGFPEFGDAKSRERIPDPNAASTFEVSVLNWDEVDIEPYKGWLDFVHDLVYLRRRVLVPRLKGVGKPEVAVTGAHALWARWPFADGSSLEMHANFGDRPAPAVAPATGRLLFGTHGAPAALPPWCVTWYQGGKA